jgi:hypothetical protein
MLAAIEEEPKASGITSRRRRQAKKSQIARLLYVSSESSTADSIALAIAVAAIEQGACGPLANEVGCVWNQKIVVPPENRSAVTARAVRRLLIAACEAFKSTRR